MAELTVHSSKDRKPRYWVTGDDKGKSVEERIADAMKGNALYESDDASKTIQWAIDRATDEIAFEGESRVFIQGKGTRMKVK